MKVFESFAGYGSQRMALRNIGIEHEVVGISEIDKYAISAYNTIHGETKNYGDITSINWSNVSDFDLFTYSFPCTDISIAGETKGLSEGSGTRSSLLWECKKAIETKKPKYLLMENVKNLIGKRFLPQFLEWQLWLSRQGYTNFVEVLNAKDFGVPQNRERLFLVSILGDAWYNFPQKQPLNKCLGDILEKDVDEKYYLSDKLIKGFILHSERHSEKGNGFKFEPNDISHPARCISTRSGCRPTDNYIKAIGNVPIDYEQNSRVYDEKGLSPTISTCTGGGRQPKVLQLNKSTESGGVQPYQQNRIYDTNGVLPAIGTTNPGNIIEDYSIRRLTPKECFRLMDVKDEDFLKLNHLSDTQLYKLAGNSIVVSVLEGIFKNLFNDN